MTESEYCTFNKLIVKLIAGNGDIILFRRREVEKGFLLGYIEAGSTHWGRVLFHQRVITAKSIFASSSLIGINHENVIHRFSLQTFFKFSAHIHLYHMYLIK